MNRIDRLERQLYTEIIVTVLIVLISIPIWLNFNLSTAEATARMYDNYDYVQYSILNKAIYTFEPVSDEYALSHVETEDIIVYNNNMVEGGYAVLLRLDNNSFNNIDDVKISINYDVDYLNNYLSYKDDKYTYFVLDDNSLSGSSYKYAISMWTSEGNLKQDLAYEFIVDTDVEI